MSKQEFVTIHGNEWETPKDLFDILNKEFNFTCDLACSKINKKVDMAFHYPEFDSLKEDWHKIPGWLWLNPPYSPLRPWLEKAQKEHALGAKIVVICPPILSTRYFSKTLPSEIRFLLGRVPFLKDGKPLSGNTKDSCLLIFGPTKQPLVTYWEWRKK